MLAGAECLDTTSMEFTLKVFNATVANMWGQTVSIMRKDGTECAPGEIGKVMVKLPLPPGAVVTFLKRHDAFVQDYLEPIPGYYDTKDEGCIMEGGGITITGRTDDVINVGPYRVAGSNVEEVILHHPDVIDCIVVGVPDALKGEVPLALFITRKSTEDSRSRIVKEVNDLVLEKLGESIFFRGSICVQELPRTLTGKIQRKVVRELLHGKVETETHPQQKLLVDLLHTIKSSGIVPA